MSLKTFLYNEVGSYLMVRKAFLIIYDPATAIWIAQLLFYLRGLLNQGLIKDGEDWFYCKQSYIKEQTNLETKTQQRIIKNLVADNLLEVEKQYQGEFIHSNLYRINEYRYRQLLEVGENEIPKYEDIERAKTAPSNVPKGDLYNKEKNNKSGGEPKSFSKIIDSPPESPAGDCSNDLFKNHPKKVKDICMYWNDNLSDILPKLKIAKTQTFKRAINGIEKALKEYSVEDIAMAMENYHTLISMKDTKLNMAVDSHKVSLPNFFEFSDFTRKSIPTFSPIHGIKSWFDEALNGFDYLFNKYSHAVADDYPEVSAIIKKQWESSPYHIGSLSPRDENNFKVAATKLVTWLDKNEQKYNLDSMFIDYPQKTVIKYLFPALKDSLGERDPKIVTTGWLANDSMYDRTLHLYLKKLGL